MVADDPSITVNEDILSRTDVPAYDALPLPVALIDNVYFS